MTLVINFFPRNFHFIVFKISCDKFHILGLRPSKIAVQPSRRLQLTERESLQLHRNCNPNHLYFIKKFEINTAQLIARKYFVQIYSFYRTKNTATEVMQKKNFLQVLKGDRFCMNKGPEIDEENLTQSDNRKKQLTKCNFAYKTLFCQQCEIEHFR